MSNDLKTESGAAERSVTPLALEHIRHYDGWVDLNNIVR